MDDKKYQVFISSTYKDLIKARDKVIETILSLHHFPIGMEMFSADDDEQWEIIKSTIDVSDYYVIIIGHRYGTMTSEGISYTEKEYDYAKFKGIPILAFIRDRNTPTTPEEREKSQEANEKLEALVEKAAKDKMCDFWVTIDELSSKVAIALPKVFSRKPRIGWVRGSNAISKEVSEELARLSAENRRLRDQLIELEKNSRENTPQFSIKLDSRRGTKFTIPKNIPLNIEKSPEPITMENIPSHLTPYISQKDIDDYNAKIPSQDDISEFNKHNRLYHLCSHYSTKLTFRVKNIGTCKANDVNIIIKFPSGVFVARQRIINKIDKPSNPLPANPITWAEVKYKRDQNSQRSSILKIGSTVASISEDNGRTIPLNLQNLTIDATPPININQNRWISVKNNVVTIKIENLLHTKEYHFDDDIYIVPIIPGEYIADIQVICEELKNTLTSSIKFEALEIYESESSTDSSHLEK
jgi:hypothetical protein